MSAEPAVNRRVVLQGLMGLLRGENFGKLIVRVSGS
jgi:NADPH-dependent curcumin reductase CurA